MTDPCACSSENCISDRRSNSGRWLAQPDRRFRAGNKLNVHFQRFSHTEHSVAIEICILRFALWRTRFLHTEPSKDPTKPRLPPELRRYPDE